MPPSARSNGQRRNAAERERDRELISDLMLQGKGVLMIAEATKLSRQTVWSDVKKINKAWREKAVEHFNLYKQRELANLEQIERKIWDIHNDRKSDFDQKLRALDRLIVLSVTRMKLLGLAEGLTSAGSTGEGDTTNFTAQQVTYIHINGTDKVDPEHLEGHPEDVADEPEEYRRETGSDFVERLKSDGYLKGDE